MIDTALTLDGRDDDQPRERLFARGVEVLSDAELVALLLRTGGAGQDSLQLSRALLRRFGGLRGLRQAGHCELLSVPGLGAAKLASLLAALELGERLAQPRFRPGERIGGPADVYRHTYPRWRDASHECFLALILDARHRVVREVQISQGTLTASLVHPREVFRPALREAAAALVLVHNHPSGDPAPSREDRQVTTRLAAAGELLGVRVLDHLVVAEGGYFSFADDGALDGSPAGSRPSG